MASRSTHGCGRFAPSPSGDLHLGNLRTALLAWLYARASGRAFLVRVDDLDPDRSRREVALAQLADLAALGLDWDGEPVWQSQRRDRYEAAIAALERDGRTYPCFCTRADVRQAASAPHGPAADGGYPGTCSRLDAASARARVAAGEPFALRVRAEGEWVAFDDEVQGSVGAHVDDFVVRRKDGVAAYNVAVVVDDAAQRVDQVVRGADLAPGTPRQIWLARALELPAQRYAHVPLLLGTDGARLAKRHGAVSLRELAALGWDGDAVRGLLAHSLGLAAPGERPSMAALLARFDPARVPRRDGALELPRASAERE